MKYRVDMQKAKEKLDSGSLKKLREELGKGKGMLELKSFVKEGEELNAVVFGAKTDNWISGGLIIPANVLQPLI